ncbi:His-Xaa-Ser system radical SAM maturase HxsC [Methylobacter sp. YRD-M1]|uniref:His-Xaa-Ser system radical SAM maturase HxsC n=1 Tax=Methylobacter sp. YRD-M1 TaxID=2911520 RepID=UPI00227CAE4B|nr:His-Xaa-Ser system radical SAM maturase HxsC [Methylobacter sp. YRD-M1]WAK04450.1 His-Xaa-Ser system radical SAM maturase HxsC [Methylobacter sp. YRD-M1]
MIYLHSKNNNVLGDICHTRPFISKVTTNSNLPVPLRASHTLRWNGSTDALPQGFGLILLSSDTSLDGDEAGRLMNVLRLAPELDYLKDHDVIKFQPTNCGINVLYRHEANSNSFLVTERCNSFCIMCSQPPRDIDDHYLVDDMLEALPMIHPETHEIGITGGEPTLWGDDFIRLIQASKVHLPGTALHILSNGRNFKNLDLAIKVAKIKHHDLMIGIPLYADYSQLHDYIVQADDAFDDTIRGILNLKRCRVPVEIRVVIHRENYRRLPHLAEFITRNLLFVDHVALMGLEIRGFAKSNLDALWIDSYKYRDELAQAVDILAHSRMRVSIYNHPLCIISESARPFAVKSISDWKNDFLDECLNCNSRQECGGFFSSNLTKTSSHIKAL